MLLVGANLLMSGFAALTRMDPGFRPDHLMTFDITTAEPYTGCHSFECLQQTILGRQAGETLAFASRRPAAEQNPPHPADFEFMRLGPSPE